MDDARFTKRMNEARRKIESLPPEQQAPLLNLLDETQERHAQMKDSFTRIHDAVADWKVGVQYLLFDLEATKRELLDFKRRQSEGGNDAPPGP